MTPEPRPIASYPTSRPSAPPSSPREELSVLGSVMLDTTVLGRIAPLVEVRDFATARHALIYAAMLALDERGERIDFVTVTDELERTNQAEASGGESFVGSLIEHVATPIHAEAYARTIARTGYHRRLIQAATQIAQLGFANAEAAETTQLRVDQLLAGVTPSGVASEFVAMPEALGIYVDQLEARTTASGYEALVGRVPTTYRDLDALLGGGFSKGELILMAGRPAMGKTALMLEMAARSALRYALHTAVFSLEMSVGQLLHRMVATTSGVPLATLAEASFSPSQGRALGEAIGRLAETRIVIDPSASLAVSAIRSKVRRLANRGPLDLVIVDHIQLVSARAENRVAEMGVISRGLKALAVEQNVAVLALSQLSRAVEQRADKVPILSDLRDSGALEQDADVVLGLYRDEYYTPNTERTRITDVLVLKNRNGQTGKAALIWNPETTGFRGMEAYDGLR